MLRAHSRQRDANHRGYDSRVIDHRGKRGKLMRWTRWGETATILVVKPIRRNRVFSSETGREIDEWKGTREYAAFLQSYKSWDVVSPWSSFDLFYRSRSMSSHVSYVICLAALFPSSWRIIRKLYETVGGTSAIFRDAWVLIEPISNIHTWLRLQEHSTPR